jgi:hypothetical protein
MHALLSEAIKRKTDHFMAFYLEFRAFCVRFFAVTLLCDMHVGLPDVPNPLAHLAGSGVLPNLFQGQPQRVPRKDILRH